MSIFEPIGLQEKAYARKLDDEIAQLRDQYHVAQAVAQLVDVPQFQAFIKLISEAAEHAEQVLRDCTESDSSMRVYQGRVQAYRWVADVCRNRGARAVALAQQIKKLQDQRERAVLPSGRVAPGSLT